MEKIIWFVGWKDKDGKYNECKVGDSVIKNYDKEAKNGVDALTGYMVRKYGQYAWDNMIYLQHIDLIDEEKGFYEMFCSDPNDIYPETKNKMFIVDEDRVIVQDITDTIEIRKGITRKIK